MIFFYLYIEIPIVFDKNITFYGKNNKNNRRTFIK